MPWSHIFLSMVRGLELSIAVVNLFQFFAIVDALDGSRRMFCKRRWHMLVLVQRFFTYTGIERVTLWQA